MAEAAAPHGEAPQHGGPPEHDESIVQMLASKILIDWLRNRQQLLVPLTLDLQKLEAPRPDVVLDAIAAAAGADGADAAQVRARVDAALNALNASAGHRAAAETALAAPKALSDVLSNVEDVRGGAVVYAASLLATDRRKLVNRNYLRYLAARLDLPQDLARNLEKRFRPPV